MAESDQKRKIKERLSYWYCGVMIEAVNYH